MNITIRNHDISLLSQLTPQSIQLSDEKRTEYKSILWRSICSEYDSINFYNQLIKLDLNYSSPFVSFLDRWLKDESMHTAGFKKIFQVVYETDEDEMDYELAETKCDFSAISEFLNDELSICLLLAFDEIVTTHVYERSVPFYSSVEPCFIPKWIKKIKSDEAKHFIGITKVIKSSHQYTLNGAKKILDRIVAVDASLSSYTGTFVLDHSCPEFPLSKEELVTMCANTVLKKIS